NPELESRRFLVPGSISLIMMMIGSLLTALVVSREWERGTLEALLATPVGILEFIIGKLVPNFVLGLCAMAVCVLASVFVFDIP
ncbi:ABC transporter permease, partial [Acinetobacter baumannii]